MKIFKVDTTNPKEVNRFIRLSSKIYNQNKFYAPPLESEIRFLFNKSEHPYYKHSEADFFMVESNGETLGRIAVLRNNLYCAHHHQDVGFFYLFESVDDYKVSSQLFNAAIDWCQKHHVKRIIGPKGFIRNNCVGLLIKGFEHMPATGITYNLPYYESLIENAGFVKETDYHSGYLKGDFRLPPEIHQIAEKVKERSKFWVKTFKDKQEMTKWIPVVNRVHHDAFQNNLGYHPTTDEEFLLMARSILSIADPRMIKVIMKGDELAGFILAYPNITRGLQKIKGKLWPFGWLILLIEKRTTKVVDLNGVGLLPKFQGSGANALLYSELEKSILPYKFERGEYIQVDERNAKSYSDSQHIGVTYHKIHRLFQLVIPKRHQ